MMIRVTILYYSTDIPQANKGVKTSKIFISTYSINCSNAVRRQRTVKRGTCEDHLNINGSLFQKRYIKANRPHVDNKFNELIDSFTLLNLGEHLNDLETEGKDKMTKQHNTQSAHIQITHKK